MQFTVCAGVAEAQRALLRSLRGRYTELAKDRTGSHLLLKMWAAADAATRKTIVTELAEVYIMLTYCLFHACSMLA